MGDAPMLSTEPRGEAAATPPEPGPLRRNLLVCGVTAVLAVGTYYLLPESVDELSRRTAAIFVVAAVFWATEALPLYATSLCVIGFEILFLADRGGLAHVLPAVADFPTQPGPEGEPIPISLGFEVFLASFANSIIILFLGGFLLAAAVTKHGLDRLIAARFLRPFSRSPLLLIYGILGITAFFSMWMSNTATTAMMLAIVAPLLANLQGATRRFELAVILAVPFGANIGGMGTPIGTPPNAVALAALRERGIVITFLEWMLMAVPLALLLLGLVGLLLYALYRPGRDLTITPVRAAGKIGPKGWITLAILLAAIALWLTSNWHGLHAAVVALLAAAALTAFRVLDSRDVDSIDWNVLILMWGGLSLGLAMEATGLTGYVSQLPIQGLGGIALAAVVVLLAVGFSTFMSNTATANLIVPIVMALSMGDPAQLAVLGGLACSFAMAMPVSTPPNAMAFATGRIPVQAMVLAGGLVSLVSMGVLLLGYRIVLPWVMG